MIVPSLTGDAITQGMSMLTYTRAIAALFTLSTMTPVRDSRATIAGKVTGLNVFNNVLFSGPSTC